MCILVISITIYWKTTKRDRKWEENCKITLKISKFSIIDLYRKSQKSAKRPQLVRTISREPSLLETNGKKLLFPRDLFFKTSLTCFLTPKKGRTPPSRLKEKMYSCYIFRFPSWSHITYIYILSHLNMIFTMFIYFLVSMLHSDCLCTTCIAFHHSSIVMRGRFR